MGLTDLLPGTLNVSIPGDYTVVLLWSVITPDEYGHDETLKLQRCLVEGFKAIIMRPDTHETRPGWGHGKNHLELMGQIHFRETLGLEDGSPVRLELEGE